MTEEHSSYRDVVRQQIKPAKSQVLSVAGLTFAFAHNQSGCRKIRLQKKMQDEDHRHEKIARANQISPKEMAWA